MPANKYSILTLPVLAAAVIAENLAIGQDGNLATAAGKMFGISTELSEVGVQLPVDVLGTTVATAGAVVAKDADLEVGAGGKLVTKAAGIVVARAMQAAGADGDKIEVLLLP